MMKSKIRFFDCVQTLDFPFYEWLQNIIKLLVVILLSISNQHQFALHIHLHMDILSSILYNIVLNIQDLWSHWFYLNICHHILLIKSNLYPLPVNCLQLSQERMYNCLWFIARYIIIFIRGCVTTIFNIFHFVYDIILNISQNKFWQKNANYYKISD